MKKYTYEVYDYSFLKSKDSWSITNYLPTAVKVAAQTIGFDFAEARPMGEPSGELFLWEPIREEGWEMNFTATPTTNSTIAGELDSTITETPVASTAETFDVYNTRQGTYTSIRYFGKTAADFMVANREAKKKQKIAEHFRRLNLIRKINKIRHGKKV